MVLRQGMLRLQRAALALVLAVSLGSIASAQIQVGGELFVDLTATGFNPATGVWTNAGTLADFLAEGSPSLVTSDLGVPSIQINGTIAPGDFFTGPVSPAGLVGSNADRTIEVWAYNPSIASEETLVSWGHRGGPDGTNISFNYGNHGTYGAVGHWGAPDIGWNDAGGAPEAGEWHHLAYTFGLDTNDGQYKTRVYADGSLQNEETLADGLINTHAGDLIRLGVQNTAAGAPEIAGFGGTLYLSEVRIHDTVLNDIEILTNWGTGLAAHPAGDSFTTPPLPTAPLTALPINRYSFEEGVAAAGTPIIDSIGGAHGVVVGDGATPGAGTFSLPGGPSDSAPYIDLPNGLISQHTDITIEGWFTNDQSQTWSRVFDFGANNGENNGEITGPGDTNGGTGDGENYIILSAQIGTDTNTNRLEINTGAGGVTLDSSAPGGIFQREYQFAVV
ncbi:MAG: LamG domain-containing protein, partial [Planctomycetales bacterium]|nr:LamG domain-containing protein [Planctomycetales bacterium]